MRKATVLAICMVLVFGSYALAQEVKIGVVNLQRALNESKSGIKAKSELEELIRQKQEQIEGKAAEHDRLKEELEQKAVVLSEDALKKRKEELEQTERDLKRMITESNTELQKKQREKEVAILQEMNELITALGKEENFMLILPAETILYSAEVTDITDRIIQRYDESRGEGAPEAAEPEAAE